MITRGSKSAFFLLICFLLFLSCHKSKTDYMCYPDNVGEIFINTCAVAGCHNTASKEAAGGLDMSSWDKMFEGGHNNEPVIPYRTDFSYLMYFINTDSTTGPTLQPTMP